MTALEGVRVLDLTRLLPGAMATMWLTNFGAEVIKIEQPGVGDYARSLFVAVGETNPVFEATNRGKKSVQIDLKADAGRAAFLTLADEADVVVESFRPGVMDRLGVGYDILAERNPRLVYCAISGFGQNGPLRGVAGHDINYIAMAGLLDMTGRAGGPPALPGTQVADLAGGSMQAIIGILLALVARQVTGRGQLVDVSMTDGVLALMPVALATVGSEQRAPRRGGEALTGGLACYDVYATADGRYLAVGALEPKFWSNLCNALGCPDLIPIQHVPAAQDRIRRRLAEVFQRRSAADWWAELRDVECCVTPVRTIREVAAETRVADHPPELIPRLSATPASVTGRAPKLGENDDEVLHLRTKSQRDEN